MSPLSLMIGRMPHWRLPASGLLALFHAIVLTEALAWFTDFHAALLVLVGCGIGIVWEASRLKAWQWQNHSRSLTGASTAGWLLLGLVWGNLFDIWLGSSLLAMLLLSITPFLVGCWCASVIDRRLSSRWMLSTAGWLLAGFIVPDLVRMLQFGR